MKTITKAYATFGAMMTTSILMSSTAHATGTSGTAGSLTPVSTSTYTDKSFSTIFERITTSFGGITGLISMFAYLTGVVFAIAGILKIKDHVEAPDKTDLKAGAMRLIAGGALFALPFIMTTMQAAIGEGGTVGAPKIKAATFGIDK